jgi:predicted DNA binding CopG/RHH family protein
MSSRGRPVQFFSEERLKRDSELTPDQVVQFIEEFQNLTAGQEGARKLISLRVPERLLQSFREKAKSEGVAYQTQIVELMRRWLKEGV